MEKKRKAKLITTLSLTVIVLAIMTTSAAAMYTIDGDLSDWGVDVATGDWSSDDTWLPNDGVEYRVEDNNDVDHVGLHGYYCSGVHIKGTSPGKEDYDEGLVNHVVWGWIPEPTGGEAYDIEAIYFDKDDDYLYFAIVQSMKEDGEWSYAPGDLALNLDREDTTGEYGYEYGVRIGSWNYEAGINQWDLYGNAEWKPPGSVPDNAPARVGGGTFITNLGATAAYVDLGISDPDCLDEYKRKPNYVVELAIPRSDVGSPASPHLYDAYLSSQCGNDHITVPEFLTIAIPVGAILGLIYVHRRKRQRA